MASKLFRALLLLAAGSSSYAYRVGIVGGGVVGGGIARIMESRKLALEEASGATIELTKVCVRDLTRERDWTPPPGCVLTDDRSEIVGNPDIDLVVEVAGGVTDAKEVVMGAIKAGQDVVTANKALIAAFMPEIEAALEDSDSQFGFEAAVMGGIPIIQAMQNDFVGDRIIRMQGIMNGCTNFMLTKMAATGCSYEDILGEAQELGYAEADPSLDVGGQDARSKLKILIKLAFGLPIEEDAISCHGITKITSTDFDYAKDMQGTIKLLGVAEIGNEDTKLSAYVCPAFVPSSATLANIGGATNALEIVSENLGSSLLVGQGAGRFPTANSCINDIVSCAAKTCRGKSGLTRPGACPDLTFDTDYEAGFYMRCNYKDGIGITRELGEVCEANGVSIFSMLQLPGVDAFVVITDKVKKSQMQAVVKSLATKDWVRDEPFMMPVVSEDE